jgi:SAM-dependent methyltransferase
MASLLNAGNRELLDSVLEIVAPTPGARIVDVGFGGGYTLRRLAPLVRPARVTGVEISEAMVSGLGDGDYDLHLADAAALPFPAASFDVVLSVNTIYFWPDPARVLAEVRRVLVPGGRLVLGYRSRAVLQLNPLTWFGFRLYDDRRVGQLIAAAGVDCEIRTPRSGERIAIGTKR